MNGRIALQPCSAKFLPGARIQKQCMAFNHQTHPPLKILSGSELQAPARIHPQTRIRRAPSQPLQLAGDSGGVLAAATPCFVLIRPNRPMPPPPPPAARVRVRVRVEATWVTPARQ